MSMLKYLVLCFFITSCSSKINIIPQEYQYPINGPLKVASTQIATVEEKERLLSNLYKLNIDDVSNVVVQKLELIPSSYYAITPKSSHKPLIGFTMKYYFYRDKNESNDQRVSLYFNSNEKLERIVYYNVPELYKVRFNVPVSEFQYP